MKKLLILIFSLFSFNVIWAFECPRQELSDFQTLDETKSLQDITECQSSKFENVLAGVIMKERDFFKKKLIKVYNDKITNPQNLSKNALNNWRENKICMEKVCDLIVNHCNNVSDRTSVLNRRELCLQKTNLIAFIQQKEVELTIQSNYEMKKTTPFLTKFYNIETKFREYIVKIMLGVLDNLLEFDGKFTNFKS